MRTLLISMALTLLATAARAGDCCTAPGACDPTCATGCGSDPCGQDATCCPRCGHKMSCKVVCTVREIPKTVWHVTSKPICISCPRLLCGETACQDDGCGDGCGVTETPGCCDGTCGKCSKCCDVCAVEKCKDHHPPKCGKICCQKTLEKKEVICKVNTYKSIPVCCHCGYGDPTCCGQGCETGCCTGVMPVEQATPAPQKAAPKTAPAPAPAPLPPVAPGPKSARSAPEFPVLGTSYTR